MAEYADIDLVKDFQNGSKKAFDALFERYYNSMYSLSYCLINNSEEAKDIAISSLTALFKLHANFDKMANIRAFLNVTTRNTSLNYLKFIQRRQEKHQRLEQTLQEAAEVVNDEIDSELIRKIYDSSIETLPPRTRQVIELLYEEELPYQQVADQLSISIHTVKNLRLFALRRLRKTFEAKGITPAWLEIVTCIALTTLLYYRLGNGMGSLILLN